MSLTPACFQNNYYEHNAFKKCFSNLLAVGFRRFTVDVYWDALQSVWSLCPVELPPSSSEETETIPIVSGPTLTTSTDILRARIPSSTTAPLGDGLGLKRRQDRPSSASSVSSVAATSITAASNKPTVISFPVADGPPLMQLGSYSCTTMMNLGLLTGLFEDFLGVTSTTTSAAITMLTLNVHAASSWLDPDAPAPPLSQPQLPISGHLLSDVIKGNLSALTYTPAILENQRADLSHSWFDVEWENRPGGGYYDFSEAVNNNSYTSSGWPTETYMEFRRLYRLIVSYGTIDSQMKLYNIGTDLNFIFPPGSISNYRDTSFETTGQLASGCFFEASENTITSETNASWAISTVPSLGLKADVDIQVPIPSVANLTSCGITALLNETLANTTADKNPLPYAAFLRSTLWSWAPGEPQNATSQQSGSLGNRCSVMSTTSYAGRWRTVDCGNRLQAACHDPARPYYWELSSATTDYKNAEFACPSPLIFDVPHTALENAHLLAAMRSRPTRADEPVYIDINSLDVPNCWVIGLNGTCPYTQSIDTNRMRIVIVPTIAAVIIFVLAALTFFIKCAANRRDNKRGRRRRMVGGWEYEGVPS